MTTSNRRTFHRRHRRCRRAPRFPDAGFRAGQAQGRRDRRRTGRRDRREICRQGRRHRCHAGRAARGSSPPASIPISISAASATSNRSPIPTTSCKAYGVKHARQMAHGDRSREEDRAARQRHDARLRPAGGRARHRPEIRFRARLFRGGEPQAAARLEGRAADPVAASASSTRSRTARPS